VTRAIELDGLVKRYGSTTALASVDLDVEAGQRFGYLGPNGAGKTTTIRILAGAVAPTDGAARVFGTPARGQPPVPHRVGIVFGDQLAPEPGFTPTGYLRYIGSLYGMSRVEVDGRLAELADLLSIESLTREIGDLSGGNQRKVEIARALLHDPDLLVLDEPTRELDIPSKERVWAFLNEKAADGVTLFVSSHDPIEIETLCERLAVLRNGHITWRGSVDELAEAGGTADLDAYADRIQATDVVFDPRDA
jgi:ABC-2 type transport system ATP-binding protein